MEDLYKGCPQIGVFTLQSNYILSSSSSIGSDFAELELESILNQQKERGY